MTELAHPAPPYPADTRAKGWRFELDHELMDQSDTWALAGDEWRPWLLMLWLVAWKQQPIGSLPDDHAVIAAKIGMPAKMWPKAAGVLMRGWWRASDGRLYHNVIAMRVSEMLAKREKDRMRKGGWRARQSDGVHPVSRGTHAGQACDDHVTPTGKTPPSTKHQAPSTGEETKTKPARKRAAAAQLVSVEAMTAEGVDAQHAADWLAVRKAKGLPLTPTAWAETKGEADKAGMTVAQAVKTAAANGWGGFRAKWVGDNDPPLRSPSPSGRPPPDPTQRNAEAKRLLGIVDNTEIIDA